MKRCTQSGIKINTFMLGARFLPAGLRRPALALNTGRVFYTTPDQMGNYIVVDYIANKRKRVGRVTAAPTAFQISDSQISDCKSAIAALWQFRRFDLNLEPRSYAVISARTPV